MTRPVVADRAPDAVLIDSEAVLTPLAAVDGHTVTVYYSTPGCIYYPRLYSEDLTRYYNFYTAMVAPFVDVTYENMTQYYDGSKVQWLSTPEDFTWFYGNNNALEREGELNFVYNYAPDFLKGVYGFTAPTLVYDDESYNLLSNDDDLFLYVGNSGITKSRMETLSSQSSSGQTFNQVRFSPYSQVGEWYLDRKSYTDIFVMGTDDTDGLNTTLNNSYGSQVSNISANELVQLIPTSGASMAIRGAEIILAAEGVPTASFTYKLVTVDNRGVPTDEVVYEGKCSNITFGEEGYWTIIDLEFTYDDGVEEFDYVPVKGDVALVLTDFEGFTQFSPALQCFTYTGNSDSVVNPIPELAKIGFKGTGSDGKEHQYYVGMDRWVFGGNMQLTSMAITYDLEYTYIAPDFDYVAKEEVEYADSYNVALTAESPEAMYRVVCPGSLEDVILSGANGEDIPDWLIVQAENFDEETLQAWQSQLNMTTPLEASSFILYFAAEDPSKVTDCDVVLTYKGATATFHVSSDGTGSGINAPAVDNAGQEKSVELFDLQGRSIKAAPETGLYLRRATMMDGSVVTTKVAR